MDPYHRVIFEPASTAEFVEKLRSSPLSYLSIYILVAEFVFGTRRMGMSIGKGNNDGIQDR
jgi:hypothetical protein